MKKIKFKRRLKKSKSSKNVKGFKKYWGGNIRNTVSNYKHRNDW